MECPNCFNNISDDAKRCPKCDYEFRPNVNSYDFSKVSTKPIKQKTTGSAFTFFAVVFFIVSAFMLFKGINKMTKYEDPDYWHDKDGINYYINNDADNYIINSNYANGYFILSGSLFIGGLVCCGAYSISNSVQSKR